MADEKTIPMTPGQLARMVANAAARERRRVVKALHERSAVAYEEGNESLGTALLEIAEGMKPEPGRIELAPSAPAAPQEPEPMDTAELPPVRHMDDVDEGLALVGVRRQRQLRGYGLG